ncbi:hypothetical protein BDN72DRAFT_965050 [Pluteus cervinus]|uniref:Uncharacterized protein n=1 Tax=Pluteus cervinus TaxID=181527 RepID=A0ACD3A8A5_9AGAR|nr:hypothetical protein BDN72DRAFT_965050 [Pluteus cervinus]
MQSSTQTLDKLSFLPNELLSKVLRHLDDLDLCHFIFTCRILHHCALDILFQRHCDINDPAGAFDYVLSIDTGSKPPFLLSAIHGALFITCLGVFDIKFSSSTLSRLFDEIRLITALIYRSPRPPILCFVDFTAVARLKLYPIPESQFVEAVQSLVETALKKGCGTLRITEHSGSWNLSNFGASQSEDSKKEGLGRGTSAQR